jgi:hypothetical protein
MIKDDICLLLYLFLFMIRTTQKLIGKINRRSVYQLKTEKPITIRETVPLTAANKVCKRINIAADSSNVKDLHYFAILFLRGRKNILPPHIAQPLLKQV